MKEKIIDIANKLSKGRCEVTEQEGTPVVYFHTDVSLVAFLLGLGKMGLSCKVAKPQQVVKVGRDTVITAEITNGPKIYMQMDVRGFLDVLTLEA